MMDSRVAEETALTYFSFLGRACFLWKTGFFYCSEEKIMPALRRKEVKEEEKAY